MCTKLKCNGKEISVHLFFFLCHLASQLISITFGTQVNRLISSYSALLVNTHQTIKCNNTEDHNMNLWYYENCSTLGYVMSKSKAMSNIILWQVNLYHKRMFTAMVNF